MFKFLRRNSSTGGDGDAHPTSHEHVAVNLEHDPELKNRKGSVDRVKGKQIKFLFAIIL